jgi:hypothetical protein
MRHAMTSTSQAKEYGKGDQGSATTPGQISERTLWSIWSRVPDRYCQEALRCSCAFLRRGGRACFICRGRDLDGDCKSRRGSFSVPGAPRKGASRRIPANHRSWGTLPSRLPRQSETEIWPYPIRSMGPAIQLTPQGVRHQTSRIVAVIRHREPPCKSKQPLGGRAKRLTFALSLEHYELVILVGLPNL